MVMNSYLNIGLIDGSGRTVKWTEQGAGRQDGLFQQYLDSRSEAGGGDMALETLTPDNLRALASNLVSALDRAGMHALFFDSNGGQESADSRLFSTDLLMSLRNSVNQPAAVGSVGSVKPSSSLPAGHQAIRSHRIAASDYAKQDGEEKYASIIASAAAANGLDPKLIHAVIRTESDFNATAVSPAGAQGLMQLMPATAAELGVTDPFDPEQNIQAGSRYLKRLMDRYDGDTKLALAAYNWGMGNLERHSHRMPQETVNYVAKITGLMNRLKRNLA